MSNPIWIKYGIEAYFVEQGRGRAIEKRRGNWTAVPIPLEMEIAVSPGGKAVIRGYRWRLLGIGTHIRRNRPGKSAPWTAPSNFGSFTARRMKQPAVT